MDPFNYFPNLGCIPKVDNNIPCSLISVAAVQIAFLIPSVRDINQTSFSDQKLCN